ncbi:hypothetical protein TELCIR_19550 [Teladorsagia circumcincta]|uniref:Uncharacterized protein n=1 Tax=Teladorsagia circumcincta TaxID=45464 RepID=A0A2G9TLW9_TELCI|nr:hypothetical protein TELCIR_19550 [Teladorsagia circumcincta]
MENFFSIIPGIPVWDMLGDVMLKVFEEGMIMQPYKDEVQDPLFIDNRRGPGNACMKQLGQNRTSAEGLYQVLKSKPLLNKTTVHTVIMSVTKNIYQTFIQTCPNPCWAF